MEKKGTMYKMALINHTFATQYDVRIKCRRLHHFIGYIVKLEAVI